MIRLISRGGLIAFLMFAVSCNRVPGTPDGEPLVAGLQSLTPCAGTLVVAADRFGLASVDLFETRRSDRQGLAEAVVNYQGLDVVLRLEFMANRLFGVKIFTDEPALLLNREQLPSGVLMMSEPLELSTNIRVWVGEENEKKFVGWLDFRAHELPDRALAGSCFK